MRTRLPQFHTLLEEARLARLNARRLVIQAQYLSDRAVELLRAARLACREARRRR